MAKSTEEYPNDEPKSQPVAAPIELQEGAGFQAHLSAEPVTLRDAKRELGMIEEVIPAANLNGMTFDIVQARLHLSEFEGQKYYFFCAVRIPDSDGLYGVAFGGGAVMETIATYIRAGKNAPLRCTLTFHEGRGRHEGYYTLD